MKSCVVASVFLLLLIGCQKEPPANLAGVTDTKTSLDAGLVGCWTFDEGSGNLIFDASSSNLNGNRYGASWVEGVIGTALKYDGVNDYARVNVPAPRILSKLSAGSVSVWFRFDDELSTGSKPIQPLLYIGKSDTAGKDDLFIIEVGHADVDNSRIYFTLIRNGILPLCFNSTEELLPDAWYHFVGVVGPSVNEAGERNTAYLNGEELTDRYYNYGNPSTQVFLELLPPQALKSILFGSGKTYDNYTPSFVFFSGVIDEVRIYNRPLSESEVKLLFEAGSWQFKN